MIRKEKYFFSTSSPKDNQIHRHLRKGFLNYCGFRTLLPTIKQVRDEAPESPTAQKLDALMRAQLQAYEKLMNEHRLSQDNQDRLLKKVAEFSEH